MQLSKITQIIFEMFGIFYLYFGLFSAVNALPDFQDGDIRLIGGRTENEGTVVIYHDGRWGSICDRGWDIRDGNVACHQLGFHRALQSLRRSPYGPGRTHRWLTGLRCGGRELRLDQCRPRRWGIERDERHCQQYSRSAAVVCMPRTAPSTSSSTTTTTKATTKSQATSTTERPSTKQIATTSKPTTIAPKTLFVENNIPTVKTILEEDIDEDNKEKHAISERYSNRSIIYDENNNNENVIPDQSVTNNRQISYRLQYDAQWSDTRRTKDIETSPTTEKPSTTTKKPSSTPAAPAPRFRYEEEVYSINLPMRRWVKDPLLKCWVLATVRGKILVAKPGRRPKRITKEEYYERRRNELEAQRGIEDVSNEITTRSPLNDASETHGNVVNNRIADPVRSRTTTKQTTITTKKPTTTRKPRTTTVKLTPKPTTLKTTIKSTTTTTTTPKPRTPKPTTSKPTTPKPTTPKPTTPKPTTPKPTTMKPTTTTTPKPTPAPAPADTNDDEVYALKLVKSKWIKDDDLGLWVMLSRSGKVLIAKPGQRSKKVTEDEYYQMRREKIRETQSHDRMKSDDPSPGQESGRAPAPRTRLLPIGTGGNIINGNASDLSVSSNFMIGSDLNTSRNGNPHRHGSRIGNRHRHRHGSGKMKIRLAGRRANRGKIEILPGGREEWGVICGDHWTIRETMVACRDLGLGYGQQQITKAIYGGNDQKKYYSRVRCKGNEKRMSDCEWVEHEGPVQCSSRDSVAGVICTSALPDLEPSIYMLETTTFLQDRHLYYLQCAMEENCLAPSANEAKLSRYWRQSTRRLLRFSSVVKNIGTADFKPMTDRSQWEWHACHMHYHSMDVFAHYDIMDLNGNRVAEGLKASFCLEDSACNPGIFPKYSCQNYGQQGISVGCSDNYMADIDCQWVDITDLKPGDYIFKVEVNPKMLVAEISYDNNAVICNLEYTGYYAKLSECKLTSLL